MKGGTYLEHSGRRIHVQQRIISVAIAIVVHTDVAADTCWGTSNVIVSSCLNSGPKTVAVSIADEQMDDVTVASRLTVGLTCNDGGHGDSAALRLSLYQQRRTSFMGQATPNEVWNVEHVSHLIVANRSLLALRGEQRATS